MPLSVIVCVVGLALSVMVIVPARAPSAVGVKVIERTQLAPAATDVPQLWVTAKSPLAPMLVMVKGAVPELVRVTVWATLVVPSV